MRRFFLSRRLLNTISQFQTTLNIEQIHAKYNIKISERNYNNYIVTLVLRVLTDLNEISSRLVCLGEENYISATFVDYYLKNGKTKAEILKCIKLNEYYQKMSATCRMKIDERISEGGNNV